MKTTMMTQLNNMTISQLNDTKDIINVMIKNKVKSEIKIGMKVNVVQKTKKTPGIITKIMQSKCLVKIDNAIGTIYRVPMTMLEAA